MALILIATLLILGIAFYQVIQGFFSALIMTILTILSAVLAFSYYEMLAKLLYEHQPACANALSLAGIFIISLLVLRLAFDRLIGGNVVLGVWADRIGGGILGLISGMVCVGMLTICLQMLPFGSSVLTYRAFDNALHRKQSLAPLYPDEFTLGLVNMLSNGALSGKQPFEAVHSDLLLEAFCARNTAELHGRVDANPKDLSSAEVCAPTRTMAPWLDDVPDNPLLDTTTIPRDLVVRCTVASEAADQPDKDAGYEARYCFPATHFRLTCASGKSYYPVAYLTYNSPRWEAQTPPMEDNIPQRGRLAVVRPFAGNGLTMDWVYRIPQDDTPKYITFRQTATAAFKLGPQDEIPEHMPAPSKALDNIEPKRRRRR